MQDRDLVVSYTVGRLDTSGKYMIQLSYKRPGDERTLSSERNWPYACEITKFMAIKFSEEVIISKYQNASATYYREILFRVVCGNKDEVNRVLDQLKAAARQQRFHFEKG